MKPTRIVTLLIVALGFAVSAFAAEGRAHADSSKHKTKEYPLTTCIVTENDLESMGGSLTKVYNGQEVKFCCRPCIRKFEKSPEKYLERMREAAATAPAAGRKG
jgi:YHS domain-containing protein